MSRQDKHKGRVIPVGIIGHHPLISCYLEDILCKCHTIRVFLDAEHVRNRVPIGNRPSVLIVDGRFLAKEKGIERYLRSLKSKFPNARVLILGDNMSDESLYRLLLLGARGFVPYSKVRDELIGAVKKLWEEHLVVSTKTLEQFPQYVAQLTDPKHNMPLHFSPREKLTLNMLQRGLSNKEIGVALNISERTVKFHLGNIFTKLGVHDRHTVAEQMKSGDAIKTDERESKK